MILDLDATTIEHAIDSYTNFLVEHNDSIKIIEDAICNQILVPTNNWWHLNEYRLKNVKGVLCIIRTW